MIKRTAIYGTKGHNIKTLENGEWNFHNEDTKLHLHSIHPYPAKFIPQIPQKAILKWSSKGDTILDPFCGCGTALLESILLGRKAIGVDNNEVAVLVSRAKTFCYSKKDLVVLYKFIEDLDSLVKKNYSVMIPEYKNMNYWFSSQAVKDLEKIKGAISTLKKGPQLLSTAIFSSIIVRTSYQDSDTRYTRVDKPYSSGNAVRWFKLKLKDSTKRLESIIGFPKEKAIVHHADSRSIDFIKDKSVKLIVTSPPYLNTYDYHKYHRHRLHWIHGDVPFARDTEIGKHDTFTRPNANPTRYFNDMKQCFASLNPLILKGGHLFIVIGDGIVNGKPVAVGDEFIDICKDAGFKLKQRWIRKLQHQKKSFNLAARINKEHLLLFKK